MVPWKFIYKNMSKFRKVERRCIRMRMIFADSILTNHNHQRSISSFLDSV